MKIRTGIRTRTAAALASAALVLGLALTGAGAASAATDLRTAPAATTTCGVWRWPVKTGSDATRYQVNRTPELTTIYYLDHRTPPSSFDGGLPGTYGYSHRLKWPEFRTWKLYHVDLVALKLEDDGDLHLRLQGSSGWKMIAEVPRPACVSSASLWYTGIRNVRNYLLARYSASLYYWTYVNRPVVIEGLGFFDEEHNVTGAAPNDIELHPTIYISF
jgi:hypothetical protein